MVPLTIWRSDAIVLYAWLEAVDLNAVPITHPAEKQALADLHNQLEQSVAPASATGFTKDEVDAARDEVAANMGC
jgi:hypothetical protein